MNLDGIRTFVDTLPVGRQGTALAYQATVPADGSAFRRAAGAGCARPTARQAVPSSCSAPIASGRTVSTRSSARGRRERRTYSSTRNSTTSPTKTCPHFSSTLSARIAVLGALLAGQSANLPTGEYPVVRNLGTRSVRAACRRRRSWASTCLCSRRASAPIRRR